MFVTVCPELLLLVVDFPVLCIFLLCDLCVCSCLIAEVISLIPNVPPGIGGGIVSASCFVSPVIIRRNARPIELARDGFLASNFVSDFVSKV